MKMGVGVPHRENYQWNTSCDYSIKVQGKDICVKDQGSKDAAEKNIGIFYISNDLLMAWTYYETKNYLKLQNKDLSPYDSISFPSTKMQRHVASRGALKDQSTTYDFPFTTSAFYGKPTATSRPLSMRCLYMMFIYVVYI